VDVTRGRPGCRPLIEIGLRELSERSPTLQRHDRLLALDGRSSRSAPVSLRLLRSLATSLLRTRESEQCCSRSPEARPSPNSDAASAAADSSLSPVPADVTRIPPFEEFLARASKTTDRPTCNPCPSEATKSIARPGTERQPPETELQPRFLDWKCGRRAAVQRLSRCMVVFTIIMILAMS